MENVNQHFLDHDDVAEIFASAGELVDESDSGAVLIGASYVDASLRGLFEAIAPKGFGKKKLESILDYPGPLSSFSARIHTAVLCGLISTELGDAINALRSLRNDVAHSSASFRLRDHWGTIRKVFNLGPGVPEGINRMAIEFLFKDAEAIDQAESSARAIGLRRQRAMDLIRHLREQTVSAEGAP